MDEDTLRDLAEQKEKEWRLIQEKRIDALENSLKQKTTELNEEKQKFTQLKDDFKYNLKLLEERDAELEKYEQSLIAVRKQLSEKTSEISELKIKIDELRKILESEKSAVDECKQYYIKRLNQKNNELEKYKATKDAEINKERSEIEKYKRTLQTQLQDLQFDLDKQRVELKTEFDEILRKREHEWRLQTDDFNSIVLAKDLEIKMLKNELTLLKEESQRFKTSTNDNDQSLKNLERRLKEKDWELKDTVAIKDAKLKDYENKLSLLQNNNKTIIDDLTRKNEDMDRALREKDKCIENLKRTLDEHENVRLNLEKQLDEYKLKIKHQPSANKFTDDSNDLKIDSLNDQISKLKSDLTKQIEINAKLSVHGDLDSEQMRKNYDELNFNYRNRLNEIDHLKAQLNGRDEKINRLEKDLINNDAEWQKRYQYLENLKVQDSDLLNKQLMESKNKALEQLRILEDKLTHKENVIQALQTAEPSINLNEFESNEFKLREENEKLKSIVKQMREEMENLATTSTQSDLIPTKQPNGLSSRLPQVITVMPSQQPVSINEFEEDLKRQLMEAKQKNRQLQSQIDEFVLKQKLPDSLSDNTIINSHIKTINETINILRKEKVDLTALTKKQQTKLMHMEKLLNEQNEQNRIKQTQIETLRYEMNSQLRRNTTELNNLKQITANLELELNATRREADEYHKATIEKNSEILGLETKVSELKLKLSTSGTQLNFGAQELFIQQLQDEIKRLSNLNQQLQIKTRQMHHQLMREEQQHTSVESLKRTSSSSVPISSSSSGNCSSDDQRENERLKTKLKTAAKYIGHLIQEKEHLIEMSNQLRGELNRIKYDNDSLKLMRLNMETDVDFLDLDRQSSALRRVNSSPRTSLSNKLQQLEKKQYELTKQQLAFAQRKNITKSDPVLSKTTTKKPKEPESSSITSTDDTNTVSSSVKSENLREIWKLLDENDSIVNESLPNDNINHRMTSAIQVIGLKPKTTAAAYVEPKQVPKSPKTPRSSRPATSNIPSKTKPDSQAKYSKNTKIRNYNLKD